MNIVYTLIILLMCSCQTIKKKNKKENTEEKFQKVDVNTLFVDLKAEDYKNGAYSGVRLSPELDENADFILYEICSLEIPKTPCLNGKIDGLMPELIYNAPQGEIEIFFRACVKESRAINNSCAPKKSFTMKHEIENSAPLYLK